MISEGWRRSTKAVSGDLLAVDPEVTPAAVAHGTTLRVGVEVQRRQVQFLPSHTPVATIFSPRSGSEI